MEFRDGNGKKISGAGFAARWILIVIVLVTFAVTFAWLAAIVLEH
jgi:hypothetical protein